MQCTPDSKNTSSFATPTPADVCEKKAQTRISCKLPKQMTPSREDFEAFGFTFEDVGDTGLYQATLPEGWKIMSDEVDLPQIVDNKGRKRVSVVYESPDYPKGFMLMETRFQVKPLPGPLEFDEGPYTVAVVDADDSIILLLGTCSEFDSPESDEIMKEGLDFLDETYPFWTDPTKYWD